MAGSFLFLSFALFSQLLACAREKEDIDGFFFVDETKEILSNEAGNAREERFNEHAIVAGGTAQRAISRKTAAAHRDFVYLIDNASRKRSSGRKRDTRGRVAVQRVGGYGERAILELLEGFIIGTSV